MYNTAVNIYYECVILILYGVLTALYKHSAFCIGPAALPYTVHLVRRLQYQFTNARMHQLTVTKTAFGTRSYFEYNGALINGRRSRR